MAGGGPLPVREYVSADEMRRHAAEVRARMFAPRPKPVLVRVEASPAPLDRAASDIPDPNEAMLRRDRWNEYIQRTREAFGAIPEIERTRPTARECFNAVIDVTGMPRDAIVGDRRVRDLVKARQILFWMLVVRAGKSYGATANMVGWRDHTTALHGCRRVASMIVMNAVEPADDLTEAVRQLWAIQWPDNWHRSGRKCS